VLLATADGKSIHFEAEQAREMGRVARGVKGITLVSKDAVVGVEVTQEGLTLLTLTANGYGKRTPIEEYRKQNRGGIGLIDIKTRGRNGPVVGVAQVEDTDHLMIVTSMGKVIRTRVNEVSVIGRNTQGVRLIRLEKGEEVVAMARLPMDEQDDDDDLDDDGQGLEPDEEDASDADVESDEEEDFDEDAPDAPEDDEPEDDDDYEA
jgi:DNA gyrase subunit A